MPSIGNSDHDIVLLDTTIQAQRPKPAKRKIQLWKRANIEGIKEDVANFVEDFNQTVFENIEQMWPGWWCLARQCHGHCFQLKALVCSFV
jgi:hypothetical protein